MSLDHQLFFAINNGLACAANDLWLGYATWLGNGWIAFPIAIIALWGLDKNRFRSNLLALATAGIVGGIALNLTKSIVAAPRPLSVFAQDITAGRVTIHVMFESLFANSFPSGHAQTAFTISTVLWSTAIRARKLNVVWIIGLIFVPSLIAVSRVYVGAHFPSDVLAGSWLGAGTALLCIHLLRITRREIPNQPQLEVTTP